MDKDLAARQKAGFAFSRAEVLSIAQTVFSTVGEDLYLEELTASNDLGANRMKKVALAVHVFIDILHDVGGRSIDDLPESLRAAQPVTTPISIATIARDLAGTPVGPTSRRRRP